MIKAIEKMKRDFLWEPGKTRKDHLIKWEIVCRPVDRGGLGVRNLALRNETLLAKNGYGDSLVKLGVFGI